MPVDPHGHEVGAAFEAFCSREELARAEEIWADIRYSLIAEKHPAASRVSAVKLSCEDRVQSDLVPNVIGNFIRISDISFDADQITTFVDGVKRAKEAVCKLTLGKGMKFKGLDVSDLRSDRGSEFWSEVETLRDLLDEARVALVGAEMVADRLHNLSRGDKRVGLGRALVGAPIGIMARQLAHLWLGSGSTLAGGRSGDGLDEVIVRIVEKVSGKKDRKTRRWLKDLMTDLRDELPE
jgi:hypothetical protein